MPAGKIEIANADADFAASLSEAAEAAGEDADESVSVGDSDSSGDAEDSASEDATDLHDDDEADPEADSDSADDDEDGDGADDGDSASDADWSEVAKLLLEADLTALCKKAGVDPRALQVNEPKLKAMRQGLKEAREKETAADKKLKEATEKETNAKNIIEDGKARYGHLVELRLALKAGDFFAVKELCEELAPEGTTWKQIAEGIAQAAQSNSGSEAKYRRLLREQAKERAKKEEEEREAKRKTENEADVRARAERNRAGAEKLIKGTDFEGIPKVVDTLLELAQKNWDPEKKGLKVTPKELLKQLGEDPLISAAVKLKKLEKRAPVVRKESKELTRRNNKGQFTRRSGKVKTVSKEDEFAASIAEATRLEAAQNRQSRAGRRGL